MTHCNGHMHDNSCGEYTLLEYMRSKTQIDLDSLNLDLARELGPFADCTSNQADSYFEFREPVRKALLEASVKDAHILLPDLHTKLLVTARKEQQEEMTVEELGVEIAMTRVSLSLIPLIQGRIFVMANPTAAYSIEKTVACGRRIAAIANHYDPEFDLDRLCIKVPSTWEGLNACRILKDGFGINTLATTLFTKEQAMLAADAGCIFISPFVHELRVHFDQSYSDKDPVFDLCRWAQEYFRYHSFSTKVKACSVVSTDEVLKLAGVDAFTIAPHLLRELAAEEVGSKDHWQASIFHPNSHTKDLLLAKPNFLHSEVGWRGAYAESDAGKGRLKTTQAISLFCEYQFLAEGVVRDIGKDLNI